MDHITFDLETIPNQLLPEACKPQFDPDSVKYGNTKDLAKRQMKEDEEREKFKTSITKTMSLDPAFCSVCTFSAVRHTEETENISYQLTEEDGHDDIEIISKAIETITTAYRERLPLVSFNGLAFDLPVLFFRAIAQDIAIDPGMWQKITRRYTNPYHYDLMQILAGWSRERWHKQDFYASLLGVADPDEMDGSMVFDCYQAGEYEKIKEYGMRDAESLSALFLRVAPWIVGEKVEEGPEWKAKEEPGINF